MNPLGGKDPSLSEFCKMEKRRSSIPERGTNVSKGTKTVIMIIVITMYAKHCAKHFIYNITFYFAPQ